MRHRVDHRQFSRNTSHRKAMFKNMANSVIQKEQIVTTVQKAKETRRVVDRLITLGKAQTLHARRLAFSRTRDRLSVTKLFSELAERYKDRSGGYTRVLKLSDRRQGDNAEMAILELVDHPEIQRGKVHAAPESGSGEATTPASAAVAQDGPVGDPFNRFRKTFAGSKKKAKAAAQAGAREAAEKDAESVKKKK